MRLSEHILDGIQRWQRTMVKNYARSRSRRRIALGERMSGMSSPTTLSEARDFLTALLEFLPATEKLRVRGLLQAVESAESRESIDSEDLVTQLLQGELTLEQSVQHLRFLLAPA